MEEPCVCDSCSEVVELSDLNFCVREYCDCISSCTHGICDECKRIGEEGKI